MPLLYYLRKNKNLYTYTIISIMVSVWAILALQPCAMAFDIKQNSYHNLGMAADSGQQPCQHCPENSPSEHCQFDDWFSQKQTFSPTTDLNPQLSADILISILSLAELIKYSGPDSPLNRHDRSSHIEDTPTLRRDILRC